MSNQKENGELISIHFGHWARRMMTGKRIGGVNSDDSLVWFDFGFTSVLLFEFWVAHSFVRIIYPTV